MSFQIEARYEFVVREDVLAGLATLDSNEVPGHRDSESVAALKTRPEAVASVSVLTEATFGNVGLARRLMAAVVPPRFKAPMPRTEGDLL